MGAIDSSKGFDAIVLIFDILVDCFDYAIQRDVADGGVVLLAVGTVRVFIAHAIFSEFWCAGVGSYKIANIFFKPTIIFLLWLLGRGKPTTRCRWWTCDTS